MPDTSSQQLSPDHSKVFPAETGRGTQEFLRDLDKSRAERNNRSEAKIAPHTFYRGKLPQAARRESAAALFNRWSAADRLRANYLMSNPRF